MSFFIHQCWFHFQDNYFPNPAQEIRKVMDIFTNQSTISIEMRHLRFFGLKIIARNFHRNEIAFSFDPIGNVFFNIDLNNFPYAPDPYSDYHHVKIELEYVLIPSKKDCGQNKSIFSRLAALIENPDPQISELNGDDGKTGPKILESIRKDGKNGCLFEEVIDRYICPKRDAYFDFTEVIQPEFNFTFPKGWQIDLKGSAFIWYAEWIDQYFEEQEDSEKGKYQLPDVQWVDGKLRYKYLIKIDNDYYNSASVYQKFGFKYRTKLSWPFVLLSSIIPLLMVLFSSALLLTMPSVGIFAMSFSESAPFLTSLLLVVTYSFTYLSYLKDGYTLPYQNWTAGIVAITIGLLMVRILTIQPTCI